MSTLSGGPGIVKNGLILYLDAGNTKSYPGSGLTWSDITSNISATLTNGPSFSTANNGSIGFDGVDDLVWIPFVLNTNSSFTIEVIAKCSNMDTNIATRETIWSFNSGTFGYQLLDLEIWGDLMKSFNGDGTNFTAAPIQLAATNINSNNWHNYLLSSNNGSWSWYLDGININNYTPTYTGTSSYFKLASRGSSNTGSAQSWNGKINVVKIYNRSLTAAEVLQNYNAIKSRFNY